MESFQSGMRLIKSEELLSRFRSKEDIYKYLTIHSNMLLPPYQCTRIAFLRSILSGQKRTLRQDQVRIMTVPQFQELSVKNLYQDAMNDEVLKDYLPSLDENSGQLPERDFFFKILATIKTDYLTHIINHAHQVRYNEGMTSQQQEGIQITNEWYNELTKHPFISKKHGKGIFLMKEKSRLYRKKTEHKQFEIGARLTGVIRQNPFREEEQRNITKRKRLADGSLQIINIQNRTPTKNQME